MTPIVPPDATAATLSAEAVGKCMSNRVVHLHNYNKRSCTLAISVNVYKIECKNKDKQLYTCSCPCTLALQYMEHARYEGVKNCNFTILLSC